MLTSKHEMRNHIRPRRSIHKFPRSTFATRTHVRRLVCRIGRWWARVAPQHRLVLGCRHLNASGLLWSHVSVHDSLARIAYCVWVCVQLPSTACAGHSTNNVSSNLQQSGLVDPTERRLSQALEPRRCWLACKRLMLKYDEAARYDDVKTYLQLFLQ